MEIRCDLKPMCETCSGFELDGTTNVMFADGSLFGRYIVIKCKNRHLCDSIECCVKNHMQNDANIKPAVPNLFDKGSYEPFDV